MSKLVLSYLLKKDRSAFRSAIINDNVKRIRRILKTERNYLCQRLDRQGNTALLLAIQYSSVTTIDLLLQYGAQADQVNFLTFQSPLGLVASTVYNNNQSDESKLAIEIATVLLDHGAYLDQTSPFVFKDGFDQDCIAMETPLMSTIRMRNLPMATLLVERKANVNYTDRQTQLRPIHYAIRNGDVTMFDLLENAGASCKSVVGQDENTLLHWFCSHKTNDKQISLLKRLIELGCDLNAVNNEQRTPIMLAAKLNMFYTCRVLLDAQVRLDQVDCYGYRAIDLTKLNSKCWLLLEQAPYRVANGAIVWRQLIDSTDNHPEKHLSVKVVDDRNTSRNSRFDSSSSQASSQEDGDMKYTRMLEKLMQNKPMVQQ